MSAMLFPGGGSRTDVVADGVARRQIWGRMTEGAVVLGHRQQRHAPRMNAVELGRLLLVGMDCAGNRNNDAVQRIVGTRTRQRQHVAEAGGGLVSFGQRLQIPTLLQRP
jgi:hypothetical protein